ncbi:MAG: DUF3394 domain-containing protein, partial [Campylobacterota bacterium]|nr:DUF3394 domain-containing protein [Campylobacterota bacterium]
VSAVIGMLLFAAATQGYWFVRNRWWETILLLALTFVIFRPGYIWDKVQAPYDNLPGSQIFKVADNMKAGERLHFVVSGETLEGDQRTMTFAIPLAEGKTGQERINETGLRLDDLLGPMEVATITPINKQIEAIKTAGVDSGWIVESVRVKTDRLPKQIVLIPAFIIMFLMIWLQLKRKEKVMT